MGYRNLMAAGAAALTLAFGAAAAGAADMPGKGVTVQPIKSSIAEETFQTMLVMRGLEALGYDVKDIKEIEYAAGHVAIGNGDATFMADHWNPLHVDFYKKAGGDAKLYREGTYSAGAVIRLPLRMRLPHSSRAFSMCRRGEPGSCR